MEDDPETQSKDFTEMHHGSKNKYKLSASFSCIYILLFRPSHSDIFEHHYIDASLLLFALMWG